MHSISLHHVLQGKLSGDSVRISIEAEGTYFFLASNFTSTDGFNWMLCSRMTNAGFMSKKLDGVAWRRTNTLAFLRSYEQ